MCDCFHILFYITITGRGGGGGVGGGEISLAIFSPRSVKYSLQDSAIFILSLISLPLRSVYQWG